MCQSASAAVSSSSNPPQFSDAPTAHALAEAADAGRWSHFATGTFAIACDEGDAAREFSRFVRRIEQRARGRVTYCGVASRHSALARVHVHALLALPASLPFASIRAAWRAGLSEVRYFDATKPAAFYVAGHARHDNAEILLRR